jgi:hypothetical protein
MPDSGRSVSEPATREAQLREMLEEPGLERYGQYWDAFWKAHPADCSWCEDNPYDTTSCSDCDGLGYRGDEPCEPCQGHGFFGYSW